MVPISGIKNKIKGFRCVDDCGCNDWGLRRFQYLVMVPIMCLIVWLSSLKILIDGSMQDSHNNELLF
jgi:hypothetical protein